MARQLSDDCESFSMEKTAKSDIAELDSEFLKRTFMEAGRCIYCGGGFKGIFRKKCRRCGKLRSYR